MKNFFRYLFIVCLTFWVIGFLFFSLTTVAIKYMPLEKADAIVVLTGGKDHRIDYGIDLLKEGWSDKLFISGVNKMVSANDLLQNLDEELQSAIQLGYQAENTRTNALEVAEWIKNNNISSIILVTSFYHMPRSLLEINNVLPTIDVIPHSIFPEEFDESTSWLHKRYAWNLFLEYHKLITIYVQKIIKGLTEKYA